MHELLHFDPRTYDMLIEKLGDERRLRERFFHHLVEERHVDPERAFAMIEDLHQLQRSALGPGVKSAPQLACFMVASGIELDQALTAIGLLLQAGLMMRRTRRKTAPPDTDSGPDDIVQAIILLTDFLALLLQ